MSRPPPTELLPVLCVEIDPRRCVGPSLGPSFREAMNATGHMVAKGLTGRDKEENMAYNDLVRITDEIEVMARTGRFDPDRLNALIIEQRKYLIRYTVAKDTRKGEPIPLWAMQQTMGQAQQIMPQYAPPYPPPAAYHAPQAAYPPPTAYPPAAYPPPAAYLTPNAPPMQGPPQYPAGPVHQIPPPDARHAWTTPATHGYAHGHVPTAVLYHPVTAASSTPVKGIPLTPPHSVTRAPPHSVTRAPARPVTRAQSVKPRSRQ
jgi:hypothetical protein